MRTAKRGSRAFKFFKRARSGGVRAAARRGFLLSNPSNVTHSHDVCGRAAFRRLCIRSSPRFGRRRLSPRDPPRRCGHRHLDRRERHGRRGHANRRLDDRRGDQRRAACARSAGRSGQNCAKPSERRIGRKDDGRFRCRCRRGRQALPHFALAGSRAAKSARLDAPVRRVPFPLARFAAVHADEGAREEAMLESVASGNISASPQAAAAQPSGHVAAAFDLFDPQPTVAAGLSVMPRVVPQQRRRASPRKPPRRRHRCGRPIARLSRRRCNWPTPTQQRPCRRLRMQRPRRMRG